MPDPTSEAFIEEQFVERTDPVALQAELLSMIQRGVDTFYVKRTGQGFSEFYAAVVDRKRSLNV